MSSIGAGPPPATGGRSLPRLPPPSVKRNPGGIHRAYVRISRILQQNCASGNAGLFCCVSPLHMGAKKHYTRVSTDDQSVDAQVRHRTGFKKLPRKVGSGVRTGRSQLRRVLGPRCRQHADGNAARPPGTPNPRSSEPACMIGVGYQRRKHSRTQQRLGAA
jgi:hypothetical protein